MNKKGVILAFLTMLGGSVLLAGLITWINFCSDYFKSSNFGFVVLLPIVLLLFLLLAYQYSQE